MRLKPYLIALFCFALLAGCGGGGGSSGGPAQPQAVLAMSASPPLEPYPSTPAQYDALAAQAFELAYGAGARGQVTTFKWSDLEPQQSQYSATEFAKLVAAVDQASARGMVHYLGIQLINSTRRELPGTLSAAAFDSPALIAQFRLLLDRILVPHRGKIKYLSIGNEVDIYLGANPSQWAAYQRFYANVAAYARTLDPEVRVGVTATADGTSGASASQLQTLNASSDVVILNYYPLNFDASGNVTVRAPASVAADVTRMLGVAGNRPLVLQEVGYPTSSINNSSEDLQAAFFAEVAAAWAQASARIPFVNVYLLHDFTQQLCDDFTAYYQLTAGAASFNASLCSLGLRQRNGTPKKAWTTFSTEARRLGLI